MPPSWNCGSTASGCGPPSPAWWPDWCPGLPCSAHDPVPGTRLSARGADLDLDEMADAWRAIATLHAGHVAHGALDLDAVAVDGDGPAWLRRLQSASLDAPDALLMTDRATFLVECTLAVGAERAVAAVPGGTWATTACGRRSPTSRCRRSPC